MATPSATAYASDMPGGSLFDNYTSSSAPYANLGYTNQTGSLEKMAGMANPIGKALGLTKVFGGLFGGKKKPKTPRWQRLANREWSQGNAVLSAYAQLYEPTLNMVRRQTADYADLYRRAANDALEQDIRSNRTQREADLADYLDLGPQLLAARKTSDPLFAQTYDLASADMQDVNAPLPANVQRDIVEGVRGSQVRRGMGLGGSDAFEEALQLAMSGEQFRNNRRDRAFSQARSLFDMYGDPFQALTARVSHSAPQGANVMAPDVGAKFDDLFSYGVNREIQNRNIDAAESSANKQMVGSIVGGLLGSAGKMAGGF